MPIAVGVLRETVPGERRVALVPEVVKKLLGLGVSVSVQRGLGDGAQIADAAYVSAGAKLCDEAAEVLAASQILLRVQPPRADEIAAMPEGSVLIGYLAPHADDARVKALCARRITSFAMELLPRITRAQAMDVLSSQAAVAGYKAVLIAALESGRFFPMLTTAAGTIRPSKVLVIGAGVAGLQAIATARRLGAMVEGYDVRPEVREQIESLGAKFLDLGVTASGSGGYARELSAEERAEQQRRLAAHLAGIHVIITTAAVPGRPAPKIISQAMVEGMQPGSVIVDIAAETGGNCELTRAGQTVIHAGVSIVGPVNLPSMQPLHASEMYARNLLNFLTPMIANAEFAPDWDDEIVAQTCLTRDGRIEHEPTRVRIEGETSS